MSRVGPYADIACLKILTTADYEDLSEQETAFEAIRDKHDPLVWTYACKGPGRLMPPDRYYRDLAWETFRRGGTGTGFGVVYFAESAPPGVTRAEPIIPSRRWEAFREGAEDFEYLAQARRAIAAARDEGREASTCDRAAAVLDQSVGTVLTASDRPGRYDDAREELTRLILRLRAEAGNGG